MNTFVQDRIAQAVMVGAQVVDDNDVALVVKYIGTQASGKVQIDSSGNFVFIHGAVGAEVADTTIGAPTLNGTITVSDATADTFGEVVDLINASANWVAYIRDVLRADSSNASTGSLVTMASTAAKVSGGVPIYKKTSKTLNLSVALRGAPVDADFTKDSAGRVSFPLREKGKWTELMKVISNNTFASGTSKIQVYRINRLTGAAVKIAEQAGGATTVDQTVDKSDGNGRGLACLSDEYLLVRMIGSGFLTGFLSPQAKVI